MNTEENDTEAELAAWELLAETRDQLTAVTEQRDRLAEILRNCMPFILDDGCLYRDARETLQSLTQDQP
jgi:hypothetical protein